MSRVTRFAGQHRGRRRRDRDHGARPAARHARLDRRLALRLRLGRAVASWRASSTRSGRSRCAARRCRPTRSGWSLADRRPRHRSSGSSRTSSARDGSFVPIRLGAQRRVAPAGARRAGAGPGARRHARRVPASSRRRSSRSAAPTRALRRSGSVELGRPRVDGRAVTDYGDWLGTVGVDRPHARRRRCASASRSPTRSTPICARASRRTACRSPPSSRRSLAHARRPGPRCSGRDRQRRAAPLPGRGRGAALPGHLSERDLRLPRRRPAGARERAQHLGTRDRLRRPSSGWTVDPSRREAVEARLRKPPFTALAVCLALAARALVARRAGRPRGARDAGDRGPDGNRARAARARARHAQRAARRGGGAVRPRGAGRRAGEPAQAAAAARLAGGPGRRARRDRDRRSCSRCSSSASSS